MAAGALTSAQCLAVITALQAALVSQAGVVDIMDPAGGRIVTQGPLQITEAITAWEAKYTRALAAETGRSAIAIERRTPA